MHALWTINKFYLRSTITFHPPVKSTSHQAPIQSNPAIKKINLNETTQPGHTKQKKIYQPIRKMRRAPRDCYTTTIRVVRELAIAFFPRVRLPGEFLSVIKSQPLVWLELIWSNGQSRRRLGKKKIKKNTHETRNVGKNEVRERRKCVIKSTPELFPRARAHTHGARENICARSSVAGIRAAAADCSLRLATRNFTFRLRSSITFHNSFRADGRADELIKQLVARASFVFSCSQY